MLVVGTIGKLYIRSEREAIRDPKGNLVHPAQRRLEVKFVSGGSPPEYARQKALAHLSFPGLPEHADPLSQLTWLDTVAAAREYGWNDEEQAAVENFLRENDGSQGYIIVDIPKVEAPFPNWVKQTSVHGQRKIEHVVADAVKFVEDMGLDVGQVIAFEQQQNRRESQPIIDALTPAAEEFVEEVIAA